MSKNYFHCKTYNDWFSIAISETQDCKQTSSINLFNFSQNVSNHLNSIFIMNHVWLCQIWARFTKSLWSANHRKMKLKLCRWKSLKHVMPYFAHQLTSQNGTCAQTFLSYLKQVSYFSILFLMNNNIMYLLCNLR